MGEREEEKLERWERMRREGRRKKEERGRGREGIKEGKEGGRVKVNLIKIEYSSILSLFNIF